MLTLREWQEALQSFVIEGQTGLEVAIVKPDDMSAEDRLRVYQNAYYLRLVEILEDVFPVMRKIMGANPFEAMIRDYLSAYSSHHFSVMMVGEHLPTFLTNASGCDPAYFELAAFEWAMHQSTMAKDEPKLNLEDLAKLPPEKWADLQLKLHPSVISVNCRYNTLTRCQAIDEKEKDPGAWVLDTPSTALIWRKEHEVYFFSMTPEQAHLFQGIKAQEKFGMLCERMLDYFSEDKVVAWVAETFQSWSKEGIFSNSTFSILLNRPEIF